MSLAPSVEWLDAYSEIYTDTAEADIGVVSDDDDVDGDATLKAMGSCGQVLNNIKGEQGSFPLTLLVNQTNQSMLYCCPKKICSVK